MLVIKTIVIIHFYYQKSSMRNYSRQGEVAEDGIQQCFRKIIVFFAMACQQDATTACSMDGLRILLQEKIMKRIFTVFKSKMLGPSFSLFSHRNSLFFLHFGF